MATKDLQTLNLKLDQIITIFTFLIMTDFKTDRYLNNFTKKIFWDTKTEKIPNVTSKFLSQVKTRLLNMAWSNLMFNVLRSFVTMATNL